MTQSLVSAKPEVVEAINQTALDYIDGFYEGNPARMERSLHPDLAKRNVIPNYGEWPGGKGHPGESGDRLEQMSAQTLVNLSKLGPTPASERRSDVTILDVFENTASARVDAKEWVDYMHIAKSDGHWVIVNVLWEPRSKDPVDQNSKDNALITQAGWDYVRGADAGVVHALERSLHPELAKRAVGPVYSPSPEWPSPSWPPGDKLYQLSALGLIQKFRSPYSSETKQEPDPSPEPGEDVKFFDRFQNIASMRADLAGGSVDHLHLVKWNGRWLIINILWELRPEVKWSQ